MARAARLDRFETALQKRVQQYYEQKSRAEAIEAAEAAEAHAAATHRHNYYTSVQHRLRKRPTTAPSGSDTQRQPWGRRSVQLPPTSTTMTQDDAVDVSVLRASFTSGTRGTRKATSDSPVVVRAAAKALADANRAGEALLRHRSARLSSSSSDVPRREKMENQVSVKVVKATSPSAGTTAAIGTSILSERQDLIVEANERKRRPAKVRTHIVHLCVHENDQTDNAIIRASRCTHIRIKLRNLHIFSFRHTHGMSRLTTTLP